jgi:hypothetical protein
MVSQAALRLYGAHRDSTHLSVLDAIYPHGSAFSLSDARAQIETLKLALLEKQRELDLYLHVAAQSADGVDTPGLLAEVLELRERVRVLQSQLAMPPLYSPPLHAPPPPPQRSTPLQGTLAEINYAFDLLDAKGDGVVGRWELLRGMMDTADVRGLLRLSTVANKAEFDHMVNEMGGAAAESISRHEFECYFMRRELERSGMLTINAAPSATATKDGAAGKAGAKEGGANAQGGGGARRGGGAAEGGGAAQGGAKAPAGGAIERAHGAAGAPTPQFTSHPGYVVPGYVPGISPHPAYAGGPPLPPVGGGPPFGGPLPAGYVGPYTADYGGFGFGGPPMAAYGRTGGYPYAKGGAALHYGMR